VVPRLGAAAASDHIEVVDLQLSYWQKLVTG
jgi:hypothetical protein